MVQKVSKETLHQSIDWRKECTSKMVSLQYCAIAALSYIWAGMDLPRLVSMLPRTFHLLTPASEWFATALKPYEAIANVIKQLATVIDVPNHWHACRPAELERKNSWTRWSLVTRMLQMTIDSLILIPFRWNMLDLARWTALVGSTPFTIERIRDCVMILSILCRVKATQINDKNAEVQILKIRKRVAAGGPLARLKADLDSPQICISRINLIKESQAKVKTATLKEILDLKHQRGFFQDKLASASPTTSSNIIQKIGELDKAIDSKREKLARIELWNAAAHPGTVIALRQLVAYKIKKAEVQITNLERNKKLNSVSNRYELSKLMAILFHNAILLNLSLVVGSLLYLGRFASGVTAGTFCISYIIQYIRYQEPLRLPQSSFVRV